MIEVPHWQPGVTLADIEKQVILKALRFFGNNRRVTAQSLGIAVRTLDYKLERYNGDLRSEERVHMESDTTLSEE